MLKLLGVYKNGNYSVRILSDGTKIRETNDDEFIPSFAENCDVKITDNKIKRIGVIDATVSLATPRLKK